MDAAQFAPRLAARLAPADTPRESADFLLALLRLLGSGQPASAAALAQALRWSGERVSRAIAHAAGMERDNAGRITGYALTLNETPYRFTLGGHALHAWCAFDTLFFPPLLDGAAEVQSRCAGSGEPVTLTVTPEAIADLRPAGAVISMLLPATGDDVRSGFCNRVRFFASTDAARPWAAAHPETELLPVAEVFMLARATAAWIRAQASPELQGGADCGAMPSSAAAGATGPQLAARV